MSQKETKDEPLISFGSLVLGIAVLLIGMGITLQMQDLGLVGWRAYWPVALCGVLAFLINCVALLSPGGSILKLGREIVADWSRTHLPRS